MGLPAACVCRPAGCGIGRCLVSRPSAAAESLGISTGAMDNQKRLVTRNRRRAPDGRCGKQPRPMLQWQHLPLVLAVGFSTGPDTVSHADRLNAATVVAWADSHRSRPALRRDRAVPDWIADHRCWLAEGGGGPSRFRHASSPRGLLCSLRWRQAGQRGPVSSAPPRDQAGVLAAVVAVPLSRCVGLT